MGKPRLLIIIRHAQSEGNQNRQIHQTIPDHRVKLTPEGQQQAHAAGLKLRSMLLPTDTLQIYTSPYRRTRETTEGILSSLTSNSDEGEPSPFPRDKIRVYEEPRIREQDFGNFQMCSAAMDRMWQERADYGHFFYRIPNGESAADAYDRVSGFNETLFRQFNDDDFPSVCVLVTHGLMTRVFLMKWYHWSVEYFEDLRNVNHCEFVVMKRSEENNGKFVLQNELRTWSELKRQRAIERGEDPDAVEQVTSPPIEARKRWGGCPEGCNHGQGEYQRRAKRQSTIAATSTPMKSPTGVRSTTQMQMQTIDDTMSPPPPLASLPLLPPPAEMSDGPGGSFAHADLTPQEASEEDSEAFPQSTEEQQDQRESRSSSQPNDTPAAIPSRLFGQRPHFNSFHSGRDFGGSLSGAATPMDSPLHAPNGDYGFPVTASGRESSDHEQDRWTAQSGMRSGARADALGDQLDDNEHEDNDDVGGEGDVEARKVFEADEEVNQMKKVEQGRNRNGSNNGMKDEETQEDKEGRPCGDVY